MPYKAWWATAREFWKDWEYWQLREEKTIRFPSYCDLISGLLNIFRTSNCLLLIILCTNGVMATRWLVIKQHFSPFLTIGLSDLQPSPVRIDRLLTPLSKVSAKIDQYLSVVEVPLWQWRSTLNLKSVGLWPPENVIERSGVQMLQTSCLWPVAVSFPAQAQKFRWSIDSAWDDNYNLLILLFDTEFLGILLFDISFKANR